MRAPLLLLSYFLFQFQLHAQTAGFLHFGVEDGLPQSQVTTLSQDKKGNLWIGTLSGASRFDGKSFFNFNIKKGLSENWITSSAPEKKGNVWLGHWGGGISLVTADGKECRKIIVPGITINSPVKTILQTSDSILWLGTSKGLFKFNLNRNQAQRISDNGLSELDITALASSNGNLFIASAKGLYQLTDCESKKVNLSNLATIGELNSVAVAGEDIFIGSPEGLFSVRPGIVLPVNEIKHVSSLLMDRQGRLWVGTKGEGVYCLEKNDEGFSSRSYSVKNGLNYDHVNNVFEDKEGNIWIGTELGLNMFTGERMVLYDKSAGLIDNLAWTVLSDRSGNTWVGTGSGVFIKKAGASQFEKPFLKGVSGAAVISLFEDVAGSVWIGTQGQGLFKTVNLQVEEAFTGDLGYPLETIHRITEDLNGNVWVATDQGLGRIATDKKITWYTEDNGLINNYISVVFADSKGKIWAGAAAGGIKTFDGNKFNSLPGDSMLQRATVLSVVEDRIGNLWFGVYGDGLYMFDGQRFKNIPIQDGTNSDSPLSLAVDDKNRIWLGTNRGIDRFDPVTRTFEHFGRKKGFHGVETNLNAVARDRNGALWFGCLLGVVKVDPADEKMLPVEPVLTFDGIKIFFEKKSIPDDNAFTAEQNHISFVFSSVNLKDPDKVMYQYFLEGFDRDWSPVSAQKEAVYQNLPPGTYRFMVKSGLTNGPWTKEPVVYRFEIKPPYWRTWWFNAIVTVVVAGGLLLLLELRTKKLKNSKKELELLVRERTIELGQRNMELAKKNQELKDLLKQKESI